MEGRKERRRVVEGRERRKGGRQARGTIKNKISKKE